MKDDSKHHKTKRSWVYVLTSSYKGICLSVMALLSSFFWLITPIITSFVKLIMYHFAWTFDRVLYLSDVCLFSNLIYLQEECSPKSSLASDYWPSYIDRCLMPLWKPWKGWVSDLFRIWVILLLGIQLTTINLCSCLCHCNAVTSKLNFFFQVFFCPVQMQKQTHTNIHPLTHIHTLQS